MQLIRGRSFYLRVWLPLFLGTQFVTLFVVGMLEPDGFDRCQVMPTPSTQAVQAAIAIVAVAFAVALAVWRLRGWLLVAALVPTGFAGFVWFGLLDSSQKCSP